MSLAERLQPLFDRLPEDKRRARHALWQQLVDEGFPGRKHERWRFTDIAEAVADTPEAPGPARISLPELDGLRRVGFVNGRGDGLDDGDRQEAPPSGVGDASDLVNAALSATGVRWEAGAADAALHLCTRATAGSVHLRHRVHVPADVQAVLYWDDHVAETAGFSTQTLEITLAENARLDLARVHRNHAAPVLLRTDARLAAGAHLRMTGFDAADHLSRHNLYVRLDAPGARADLNGVYAPYGKGHIDTFATVPGAIKAYSWWEHLNAAQLPWMTFADAYIMANQAWFDGLADDVKAVLREEGAKLSEEATADIMTASDAVHEEFHSPVPGQDWAEQMRLRSRTAREALKRHPWAVGMMDSRRTPGWATLTHHDAALGCLLEAGFSLGLTGHAFALLDAHLYGFLLQELALPFDGGGAELEEVAAGVMASIPEGTLPWFRRFTLEHALQPGYDFGDEFDVGLELVIEGLSARLAAELAD